MLAFLTELLEEKETPVATLKNLSSKDLTEKVLSPMGLNILPSGQKQKIFEQIQQYLNAIKLYYLQPYYGNVVFFQAKEKFFRMKNLSLAITWRPLIHGKMTIHEVPGSHLSMLKEPPC